MAQPNGQANGNGQAQPLARRFYRDVTIREEEAGWAVLLDGRPVRTPGRRLLQVPAEAIAALIAAEFDAQKEHINPAAMPATRLANSAVDGVAQNTASVLADILNYAGTDLLCYRAGSPAELARRQRELWDPVLNWLHERFGVRFSICEGVMPAAQSREALAALAEVIGRYEAPFRAASLHAMTTLTGSALLALAVAEGQLEAPAAWACAHLDEDWNEAQWGVDEEARQRRAAREAEFMAAARILHALA